MADMSDKNKLALPSLARDPNSRPTTRKCVTRFAHHASHQSVANTRLRTRESRRSRR